MIVESHLSSLATWLPSWYPSNTAAILDTILGVLATHTFTTHMACCAYLLLVVYSNVFLIDLRGMYYTVLFNQSINFYL